MIFRLFAICLSAAFVFSPRFSAAQKQDPSSLLWEISGKNLGAPSYLFGTIHLICREDFSLDENLKERFGRAQQVVLEMDMDDPELMVAMASAMMMKNGAKLSRLLPAGAYQKVTGYFRDSLGMDISAYDGIKPLMLIGVLFPGIMACEVRSYEAAFVEMAGARGIPVEGLETVSDQMAAFDRIPEQAQARLILSVVENPVAARREFIELVRLYKLQDTAALFKLTRESRFSLEGADEMLLDERNRKWIPVMEKFMTGKPTFFAVGAAHLDGAHGVISLLKKQGYMVKPL